KNHEKEKDQKQDELIDLRQTIESVTENLDDEELDTSEIKKKILTDLDDLVTRKLVRGLEKNFGDKNFKVELDHVAPPSLGSSKAGYKFALKKVSWTDGPSPHKVFYYIRDKYRYYLGSDKFKESMFIKTISDIDKRFTSFFFPLPIGNRNIEAIEIFPNKVIRGNNKDELYHFSVDVVDPKLDIKDVRGDTLAEALSLLQIKLEGIYYMEGQSDKGPKPYDLHKYFLKKYVKEDLNTESTTKE
ncbi:MAG TPA: hypothetical protein VFX18_05495, partial [Candidatus Nitrosocosmicus sp.]|nr:hypothetical protein [Candidatus Nitrosocosmicus sp.]